MILSSVVAVDSVSGDIVVLSLSRDLGRPHNQRIKWLNG